MANTKALELDTFLSLRLRRKQHAAISALARKNERTVAAEIRVAIDNHLKEAS